MKLKFIILVIGLNFLSLVKGQSLKSEDTLIFEINTNYKASEGIDILEKYNFRLYSDSLVMTVTGGLLFNAYKEENIPLTKVYPYMFRDNSIGEFNTYSFGNNKLSILVSNRNNKPEVIIMGGEDIYTGKVKAEIRYYYSDWNAFKKEKK